MSLRVDPSLLRELKEYGAIGIEKCFNCGNCTAICPLTSDGHPFPRDMIRFAQMGLRDRLLERTDAWQCYYCGECSQTCPRGAEPAETMMSVRRWLTAQYDSSGHGAKLYRSERAVFMSILRGILLNLFLLFLFYLFGIARLVTDRVELNTVFPVTWVWIVVLIHFVYLAGKVVLNMLNMAHHVLRQTLAEIKIPISIYISEFKSFILHFFTQRRWRDCEGESRTAWLKHLLFMSGYGVMLLLIIPLLWWFQTDKIYPIYHPQRWLGYYATIVLTVFAIDFLRSRARKQGERFRFSHPSDWMFPVFILIGAVTGILIHIFRYLGVSDPIWAWPTYIIYVVHVLAMAAMLDTEVGIGKWMHMMYRPLAMYLDAVIEKAREQAEVPARALSPAD
jgi:quinone-modifying oxidoreductase, subunit QmoC